MTIVFTLFAPMQSWGVDGRFSIRFTGKEPSKSAIIGLISSAMGSNSQDTTNELNNLRFAVRTDWAGGIIEDYHTAGGDLNAKHYVKNKNKYKLKDASFVKKGRRQSVVTHREYLNDSMFTVAIEGDVGLLQRIVDAFKKPKWHLYLGRKSCPLGFPVVPKMVDLPLLDVLKAEPVFKCPWQNIETVKISHDSNRGEIRRDVRIGTQGNTAVYGIRFVESFNCSPASMIDLPGVSYVSNKNHY